jgi:ABC-type lipoprotein release transport system permease subunit
VFVLAIALAASWLPAARVGRIAPASTLRDD